MRIIADNGKVVAVECIRMELGEPDKSGRRSPVPIPGSEFIIETDILIVDEVLATGDQQLKPGREIQEGDVVRTAAGAHSTVTDFARFLGLSTSVPRASAAW